MHKNHNSCLYIFQIIPLGTLVNAILCPFCKLKTVQAMLMKLHTVVEHETVSYARTLTLLCIFWSYFPLIICNAISCPLCKLKTISYLNETSYSCKAQ